MEVSAVAVAGPSEAAPLSIRADAGAMYPGKSTNSSGQIFDLIEWPSAWHLLRFLGALCTLPGVSKNEGSRLF